MIATCHYCGAPLIGRGCPRCSYHKPAPSREKGLPTIFTGVGDVGRDVSFAAPQVKATLVQLAPQETETIPAVTLADNESLLLFIFTDSSNLLGFPIWMGQPTWNGVDANPPNTWSNPADLTLDTYSVFYWNRPGTGTSDIVCTFDVGDDATRRIFVAVTLVTDDVDPLNAGQLTDPLNQSMSADYSGTSTQTDVHLGSPRQDLTVVFSVAQLHQGSGSAAGTWQNGFTRLFRTGTDETDGFDLTGDVAYKFFKVADQCNAQLSGFPACRWGHLSFEVKR